MKIIDLLTRNKEIDLTTEEDAHLTSALASAYYSDEISIGSRHVQRIAEKVRACLDSCSEEEKQANTKER